MMNTIHQRASHFFTALLVASVALTPLLAVDALAGRGSLTSAQKAEFKGKKTQLMKTRAGALAKLRQLQRPYDTAKRDFERADRAAVASRRDLDSKKTNLDALTSFERTAARNAGTPWTPSIQHANLQVALQRAEQVHTAGPKANYEAALRRFQPIKRDYDAGMATLRDASNGLVTRKADKNAARQANLEAATARKEARRQRATRSNGTQADVAMPDFPNVPVQNLPPGRAPPAVPPRPVAQRVMFKIPPPPSGAAGVNRPLPARPAHEPTYTSVPPLGRRAIAVQYDAALPPPNR